jgi:hypothetical protein
MSPRSLYFAAGIAGAACVVHSALAAVEIRVGPFLQDAEPSSLWIVWETTEPGASVVEYGLTAALGSSSSGTSAASQGTGAIHNVQLTGLTPDTGYHYRVRTGAAVSATYRFRTPPLPVSEHGFRFVAYSDTQGGSSSSKHTEVINDGVIAFVTQNFGPVLSDALAFTIEPGDLVDNGLVYEQWKTQWFDEEQNLIRHVPPYPVPGNHEQDSPWFFRYFKLPENGTPGYLEHWWAKDYSNVRIIGLDSNAGYRIQAQLDWLDAQLADAAARPNIDFVFAQMHHPHKSEMWSVGELDYSGEIVRRLEAFSTATGKPTIHFFGHTHAYSRGQSRDHDHLYVNVATGEGNIDYWGLVPAVDYPEFQRSFVDWGFVLMEVQAGADPQFRLRRVSRGNDIQPRDNEVMDDLTVRRYNTPPATPTPQTSGGTLPADDLTLQAGEFSDPNGDFHLESQFQVRPLSGTYEASTVDRWIRFENWFSPAGATGASNGYYSVNTVSDPNITRVMIDELPANTDFAWRVRYRDSGLKWSDWSAEATFRTADAITGACCLVSGLCQQLRESECAVSRGVYQGDQVSCTPSPCPPVLILLAENFEGLSLGPNVNEPLAGSQVWTATPPAGWAVDRSGVPAGGVTEWRGWGFADRSWWAQTAGDQLRSQFTLGQGAVAIADPDEWDDASRSAGLYNTFLTTPPVSLAGANPGSARLVLDSSWRPEDAQTATIRVSFDGGAAADLARWTSGTTDPTYKPDATNETLTIPINNPQGATSMTLSFGLTEAGNNWWWAIDNIYVLADPSDGRRVLLAEDFESVALGPNVDETLAGSQVWSGTPPAGWSVDDSGVPGVGDPSEGVTEWEGWAFTERSWWTSAAGDQNRSQFTRGQGTIAVADPDEWDDRGNPEAIGSYNAAMSTPPISLVGIQPSSLRVAFDSSWRPEGLQQARVTAAFDGDQPATVMQWDSFAGPTFKPDATNERVVISIDNPPGASQATLTFWVLDARNNWWWAIDNVDVSGADITCPADMNADGGIDGADIETFFTLWERGSTAADINLDGGIDGGDVEAFFRIWEAGGC